MLSVVWIVNATQGLVRGRTGGQRVSQLDGAKEKAIV